ncbi:Eco57I restriction-modification methylase domain-containing protein [Okibacterium fritillariae]|nr:Eco57I restriction-modification methylase domain-containing protein [Okibacterium fritillariae]
MPDTYGSAEKVRLTEEALAARSQVFTPSQLSDFMAKMLDLNSAAVKLLDPGAGAGSLSESAIAAAGRDVSVTLVERDRIFRSHLEDLLGQHADEIAKDSEVVIADFLVTAAAWLQSGRSFTHVIMNPPYQRIGKDSSERHLLKRMGVQTSNMYAAFLWLGMDLLSEGGQLVAVVPRSILSGAQFRSVRQHLMREGSLYRLHHFHSRKAVFRRDRVQQEVVVLGMQKGVRHKHVRYSWSDELDDLSEGHELLPATRFSDGSADDVIVIPADVGVETRASSSYRETLIPEGISVSVGPVVDFRNRDYIHESATGGVPLIGSELFSSRRRPARRLNVNQATERFVMPKGLYIALRRISPPETRPRLQAMMVDATSAEYEAGIAFENHVLFIHRNREGLSLSTCRLLLNYLTADDAQRQIAERSGSTQINVADVAALRR